MATMTLDELKAKVGEEYSSWVETYGANILTWTADRIQTFITYLASGDWQSAYRLAVEAMADDDALAEAKKLTAQSAADVKKNAEAEALRKKAQLAALSAILTIVLAAIGL